MRDIALHPQDGQAITPTKKPICSTTDWFFVDGKWQSYIITRKEDGSGELYVDGVLKGVRKHPNIKNDGEFTNGCLATDAEDLAQRVRDSATVTVVINGQRHEVSGRRISYDDVVSRAGLHRGAYTITYRSLEHNIEGTLWIGDSYVRPVAGMTFNVWYDENTRIE